MFKQTEHLPDAKTAQSASPTDRATGLTVEQARQRLAQFGANAVSEQRQPGWRQLVDKLWGPVPWMLETAVTLQWLLGRRREALIILFMLAFNAAVSFAQGRRARDALALQRRQLQVRARVLREASWSQIPAAQLVPGDVVHVRAGDIVPADLRLFDGHAALDQSALTGESLAVDAAAGDSAYTGSIVRQGEVSGEVVATGASTYFGRTAELVRTSSAPSQMQQTILAIVKRLVVLDVLLVVLVVAYATGHGLPLGDTAVFALMLLVASVPVALPATYTLTSALAPCALKMVEPEPASEDPVTARLRVRLWSP